MKDHTSHIVTPKSDGNQEKLFARGSGAASVTARGATRQIAEPDKPGGGEKPPPPPKPEPEVVISIHSPASTTVEVPLSQGTFTVSGSAVAHDGATFSGVIVDFGTHSKPASGKSSWKCTSPIITTSRPLRVTARALNSSAFVYEASVDVNVVVTDDVGPIVTITQPAVDGLPATETNSVFTVALKGTATDTMSGVQKVQVGVDGTDFTNIVTPAAPFPATLNWATTVTVPVNLLQSTQSRTISIRAFDGKNNQTRCESGCGNGYHCSDVEHYGAGPKSGSPPRQWQRRSNTLPNGGLRCGRAKRREECRVGVRPTINAVQTS